MYPNSIKNIIECFKDLPGIGEKTAERLAFSLINFDKEKLTSFSDAICDVRDKLTYCDICGNITENEICDICADKERKSSIIFVVEKAKDISLFEKINIFNGNRRNFNTDNLNFFTCLLFGIIFSIGWTPCVGAFLGSALMLASQQGQVLTGMLMLLAYSLGLGIPFILSAVLIQKLKSTFDFIKRNYKVINSISGIFLVLVGIMMATGTLGRLLVVLS